MRGLEVHSRQGRVAFERGLAIRERQFRVDISIGAFVVNVAVEKIAQGARPGFEHHDPSFRPKYPGGFVKE